MSRVWRILLAAALPAGIALYLAYVYGYAAKQLRQTPCSALEIKVAGSPSAKTITQDDIAALFSKNGYTFLGKAMGTLPIGAMEDAVKNISFIKNADVYSTIDGVLHVDMEVRMPIVRIFTPDGSNFYIDNEGFAFRMPAAHACHVPIVNGNIALPFTAGFQGSIFEYADGKNDSDSAFFILFEFIKYVAAHPLWSAQIEQIYFASPSEVELIPRVGAHVIKLGSIGGYQQKLRNLHTFYTKGLPRYGWNAYRTINLSVPQQVICERR
jgi:cell division protein FtsQ